MQERESFTHDVIVVGGGPCGLLTGLLLARSGLKVAVFERKPGTSRHPKAMGISRRTAEIFRQQGLLEQLERGSLPLGGRDLAFWGKSLAGEELARIPLMGIEDSHSPCRPLHCPQTRTEAVLAAALKHEAPESLFFGSEVTSLADEGEKVVAIVDGGRHEAVWAVAADGAGSGVRHALGIGTDGPGDLGHFVNVRFRANYGPHLLDRQALLYHAIDRERFEFFVAVDGSTEWLMHHFLQPGETPGDFPAARLAELVREASGMPGEPVEILGADPWVMSPKVARKWRAGRILLAGDAAARLSPAGGLGLNNGLQGCHNLSWKLAAVVRGEAPERLLDTYEDERRPCALSLMRSTNRNAEDVFAAVAAASRGAWDEVREIVLHSRRGAAGLGQDLGVFYRAGAFLPDDSGEPPAFDPYSEYVPLGRPGSRAPHARLVDSGPRSSLLDFFGPGFVALAGGAGGAWRRGCTKAVFYQNGADFGAPDFERVYGIGAGGVVVVRPDGYVAIRHRDAPATGDRSLDEELDLCLRAPHSPGA